MRHFLLACAVMLAMNTSSRAQFIAGDKLSGTSTNIVTDASTLSWDLADLTDLMGFKIQIDGGSQVDVGMPGNPGVAGSQAPFSSGITFTVPVSSLLLSNGVHTLTFCSYNTAGTLSNSCPTLQVTKQ